MSDLGEAKFTGETLTFANADHLTLRIPKRVEWKPLPDITAHELALAMPALMIATSSRTGYISYVEDVIDGLPPEVQRHFKVSNWE